MYQAMQVEQARDQAALPWMVALRWALFSVLLASLPVARVLLGYDVHYAAALAALAIALLTNVAFARAVRRGAAAERWMAPLVALDLVMMGAVLAASGGAGNPMSALFFVHVAIAAALLPPRATFAVAAVAAAVFGALFLVPVGACCPNHPAHGAFSVHLYGMLLAFVLSAGLVAFFLTRVRRALDERTRENNELRQRAEEASRFASLGTLAAGTAHALGTPLGTIAVLASELRGQAVSPDDVRRSETILEQIARCRTVLGKMRTTARTMAAHDVPIGRAVEQAVMAWRGAHPATRVVLRDMTAAARRVPLDVADLEAVIGVLLDNALEAHVAAERSSPIEVSVTGADDEVVVTVDDSGAGVGDAVRDRLGEPFVTTKAPGDGMGLGLYFVRSLIASIDGRIEIAARRPAGTRVTMRLAAVAS